MLNRKTPIRQEGIKPVVKVVQSRRVHGRPTVGIISHVHVRALVGECTAQDTRAVIEDAETSCVAIAMVIVDHGVVAGVGVEGVGLAAATLGLEVSRSLGVPVVAKPILLGSEQNILRLEEFILDACNRVLVPMVV